MSDWLNSETGQNVKVVKSRWPWSNPLSAYSGLSEFSQNYKVVKLVIVVKRQTGQMSNWSKSETGQNLKLVKSQSGQIHLAVIRDLVSFLRIPKWSNWSKWSKWSNVKVVKCQTGQNLKLVKI
jgi:ABC-type cobalamin/Fe3+-siderophores transport system ATPase subunit